MACSSSCPTQDHDNWGDCVRAKGLRIAYAASAKGLDLTTQKQWDKELDLYRSTREEGIQPRTTRTKDIRFAQEMSDQRGTAYDAAEPTKGLTHT